MSTDRNDLSSHQYEREADATRNRLAKNLAELTDRLTPGQVLDEVLTYTRSGGGSFLGSLGSAAKQNPIPTLLSGAGCVMFMAEKLGLMGSGSNGKHRARNRNGGHPSEERHARGMGERHYERDGDERRYGRDRHESADSSMTSSMGSSGMDMLRSVGNTAWQNPIPSLLIGAGCMMFIAEKAGLMSHGSNGRTRTSRWNYGGNGDAASYGRHDGGSSASTMTSRMSDAAGSTAGYVGKTASNMAEGVQGGAEYVRSGVTGAAGYVGEQASNLAEGVSHGASAVGETMTNTTQRVRETMHDVRDSVAGAAGSVMQSAQGVGETVQSYGSAIGGQVSQTAERTMRHASQVTFQARDRASSLINEQPLLVAAVGVAVGAAIAAVLPSTRIEDEMMGGTSDAVKKAARGVASEQFESAKAVAGRVAEEAKNAAQREGLTPDIAADAARLVGDKVKKVVTEAVSTGKSELRDMANGAVRQN